MPSGDPQRNWFLKDQNDYVRNGDQRCRCRRLSLADKLDEMLHQIRTVGHIQTPIITCRNAERRDLQPSLALACAP